MQRTILIGCVSLRLSVVLLLNLSCTCVIAQEAAVAESPAAEAAPAKTNLRVASVFSDHMVLQRDRLIPVWGSARPGTLVRVQFNGETKEATTRKNGKWRVDLSPLSAGGPLEMRVESDDTGLNFTDILVGEVWIASGQSNMQWRVTHSNNASEEIAAADWAGIRLLTVPRNPSPTPQDDFQSAAWQVCQPETIKDFSAVAYFFGRELHEKLQVPVGLISTNYGGTPMEAWTIEKALVMRPAFDKACLALMRGKKRPQQQPGGLFNGMVNPVIPYAIRGAIWYQGESNAGRHQQYHELSELMITDWRQRWGQGDFPFLLVQLAGWKPQAEDWPYLREAQLQTVQTVANTAMAVATDVGDRKDIHPRNKQDVGKRLSLAARALAYDEDIVYSGPMYQKMKTSNGNAILSFEHIGGGLQIGRAKLPEADLKTLQGFEIAGTDRKFVKADAEIKDDQVVVSSDQVKAPVAVRYNWSGWTEGNLYNVEGLPAPPFRTDRF